MRELGADHGLAVLFIRGSNGKLLFNRVDEQFNIIALTELADELRAEFDFPVAEGDGGAFITIEEFRPCDLKPRRSKSPAATSI